MPVPQTFAILLAHEIQKQEPRDKHCQGHPKMNVGEHGIQPDATCFSLIA